MKSILTLLALTLSAVPTFAQQTLDFQIKYNPSTNYQQSTEQTTNSNVNYSGSEEFMKTLKDQGLTNPMDQSSSITTVTLVKTGKVGAKITFPITIEYKFTRDEKGESPIPAGTKLIGECPINGVPALTSVEAKEMGEELKEVMLTSVGTTFEQLVLPAKQMKVGDEFTQEQPLSIPLAGAALNMNIVTHYKLTSIANGMANFDLLMEYTVETDIIPEGMKANGSGTGTLVYDIANQFYNTYNIDSVLKMVMKNDNFGMDIEVKSVSKQSFLITKNL